MKYTNEHAVTAGVSFSDRWSECGVAFLLPWGFIRASCMGSQSPPVPINGKFYVGMCIRCYSASCFSNKSPPPVTRRGWWESLSSLGTDQRLQRHTLEERVPWSTRN